MGESSDLKSMRAEERLQAAHYDRIAAKYEIHAADQSTELYRAKLVMGPMLQGIDLRGAAVLDAMCGGGYEVPYLLSRGARVTGLDISSEVIRKFKEKWPECDAVQASILDTTMPDASLDCVIVVGGLHHLPPYVQPAIDQIYRLLKPGGYLCFVEPHAGSFPDFLRQIWYRFDPLFEKNEQAIDVDGLQPANADRFDFVKTKYCGNIAYLLVYNSLVFRVPLRLKHWYSPMLITIESFLNRFTGKRLSCFVVCQWRKKAAIPAPG